MHRYHHPELLPRSKLKRPYVSIQLPIYNERYVVRRLVETCVRMVDQYGKQHAEILILDDSTDDTSRQVDDIVSGLQQKDYHIHVQRRANREGYKAGALQVALDHTRAEFVAIFDADYTPAPDFLLRTIPFFSQDEKLAIIQSRWTHLNRDYNLVTSAIAIGIDVHFLIEQTARYATSCLQNFNGSGGVLRKSALVEAGGWQADTLAEDLDASYRMQLKGYKILYLKDLPSPGEVPPTVPSFKKQQARWANGSLRTARKLLPTILSNHQLKLYQRVEAYIHLTGYVLHPMMYISFLLAALGTILGLDTYLNHTQILTPFGGILLASPTKSDVLLHNLSWGALDTMILLSLVAAWVSPIVSLRLQKLSIRKNLSGLMYLFLLGSGISISNTIEALKALFTNKQWEFKRTPKYATVNNDEALRYHTYQVPLDGVFLLEVISVLLGLAAVSLALAHHLFFILLILAPYTVAYIFIAYLTFTQSRPQVQATDGD